MSMESLFPSMANFDQEDKRVTHVRIQFFCHSRSNRVRYFNQSEASKQSLFASD